MNSVHFGDGIGLVSNDGSHIDVIDRKCVREHEATCISTRTFCETSQLSIQHTSNDTIQISFTHSINERKCEPAHLSTPVPTTQYKGMLYNKFTYTIQC